MDARSRNVLITVVVVIFLAISAAVLWRIGDDGSSSVGSKSAEGAQVELVLDRVEITQAGETHIIPVDKFEGVVQDLVLEPGDAELTVRYLTVDGESAFLQIITIKDQFGSHDLTIGEDGKSTYTLLLVQESGTWQLNEFALIEGESERRFALMVIEPSPNGITGGDMINTPSEMGVDDLDRPHTTVDFEIDPLFIEAFAQFCGFEIEEVATVRLEPSEKSRFQVGLSNGRFVQSRNIIPAGQPVWVAVSINGVKCYINPPCGNPEIKVGKLPLEPTPTPTPKKKVPTDLPMSTVTPVDTATPPATKTSRPTVTPKPSCDVCVPPRTPVATSTPPTKPTSTPVVFQTPKPPPTNTPRLPTPTSTKEPPVCDCTAPKTPIATSTPYPTEVATPTPVI